MRKLLLACAAILPMLAHAQKPELGLNAGFQNFVMGGDPYFSVRAQIQRYRFFGGLGIDGGIYTQIMLNKLPHKDIKYTSYTGTPHVFMNYKIKMRYSYAYAGAHIGYTYLNNDRIGEAYIAATDDYYWVKAGRANYHFVCYGAQIGHTYQLNRKLGVNIEAAVRVHLNKQNRYEDFPLSVGLRYQL